MKIQLPKNSKTVKKFLFKEKKKGNERRCFDTIIYKHIELKVARQISKMPSFILILYPVCGVFHKTT